MTKDQRHAQREALLIDWLNGHLDPQQEAHLLEELAHDTSLQRQLAQIEDQMAQMMLNAAPMAPAPELKSRIMASVQNTHPLERFSSHIARLLQISMDRAATYLRNFDTPSNWEMIPIPGVWLYHVEGGPELSNAITGFVRLRKGALFPDHEHAGVEHLFVLQGTLINSGKTIHRPGDLIVMEEDSHHYLEASPDEDVYYLSVIDRGIRMFGMFIDPNSPLM